MNNIILTILLCLTLSACGSLRTFHEYARAGDTVAIPVGMQPNFNKDNITVTITPSAGAPIVLPATDPAIRSIINFYPDPVSSMNVSRDINTDLTPFATTYESTVRFTANNDKDFYQTTVFLDLPPTLPLGLTGIEVANGLGGSHSSTLDIIGGAGVPNTFNSDFNGGLLLDSNMLDSLSRVPHVVVSFDSTTIPNAVELALSHDPDETVGGAGKVFVINHLGSRKGLAWSDDGVNLKIILTESQGSLIDHMNDYKIYIVGTVTNLVSVSVDGYDNNGNVVPGVTSTLTHN